MKTIPTPLGNLIFCLVVTVTIGFYLHFYTFKRLSFKSPFKPCLNSERSLNSFKRLTFDVISFLLVLASKDWYGYLKIGTVIQ